MTIRLSDHRYRLALRVLNAAWEDRDPALYDAYLFALLVGFAEAAA
jgi:hypothetical protein